MSRRSVLWFLFLLFGITANVAWAQGNIQQNENLPTLPPMLRDSPNRSDIFVDDNQAQKQQAAQAAALRLESIKRDSERLFQLSGELKDQLDKSGHILSVEAIKKAEQIEKLAHGLKQRMKE
jgi:hypothetical protein